MKFFRHRLMNEASEGEAGGEASTPSESSNNSWGGSSDNDISIEPDFKSTMKDMGLNPDDFGLSDEPEAKEINEATSEEPQGSGEIKEAGQETDEKSLLDIVNSLGATHNDSPVSVASKDELKNLIQMGKDYTVKTQSLSEERKAFETELSSTKTELNSAIDEFNNKTKEFDSKVRDLEAWTFTFKELESADPDLFAEVQRVHQNTQKQFSNPVLNQQMEAQNKRFEEIEQRLASRENKLTLGSFDSEKASMSATEQSMKELGVTVDWALAKQKWAETGLPLKDVVGSIYFENVAKAQASKSKVDTTRAKVAAKPTGAAANSRPGQKVPQISKKLSAFEYAQEFLKQIS